MKKVLATVALAGVFLSLSVQPSFADWNHNHGAYPGGGFHGGWQGAHWWHGAHGGRAGWWWVNGPRWSYYRSPIYPYPYYNYPAPPVVVAPLHAPYGYYPYSYYP